GRSRRGHRMSARRSLVAVQPATWLTERARLFESLEAAFAVRFVPDGNGGPPADAVLSIGLEPGAGAGSSGDPVPALELLGTAGPVPPRDVRLCGDAGVDR